MCAIGKYTSSDHSVVNSSMALNFMRSAKAPEISAGVMMANINWYTMKVCCGMVARVIRVGRAAHAVQKRVAQVRR